MTKPLHIFRAGRHVAMSGQSFDFSKAEVDALAAAGLLSDADAAAYRAAVLWVGAMRAACQALIAEREADHAADAAWPALPEGVAARF